MGVVEEGGMTTPLLQYVARFDGGGEIFGFGGGGYKESWSLVLSVCRIPVSICCAKRRETSFTHVLEGDKPVHHFPRFRPHFFIGQSVVVDVEGVGFWPRGVVAGRGVLAVCTRVSSQ